MPANKVGLTKLKITSKIFRSWDKKKNKYCISETGNLLIKGQNENNIIRIKKIKKCHNFKRY